MNYEVLRKKYLDKLKNTKEVLVDIPNYEKMGLFNEEDSKKLSTLIKKVNNYLDKLEKGEIEIAIVGMENSGKSTLANALIKVKEAFPTASSRATFTSTRVKYGEDKATVEFFTKEEFNEIFKEMLKKVKYPEYENTDFMSIDLENYKNYFNNLRLNSELSYIYKEYHSNINKDIIDIIEGRDIINSYLNRPTAIFSKEDIQNQKLKQFITDKYIARAVKKVEIELSSFKDTKEMVLYDVPGFNSTTKKHKEETKKALNRADAIILIKNVTENSNTTSEELEMLKEYDDSGLPLGDKIFVVGTKIDRLNKPNEIENNIKILKQEVIRDLGVKENRIFIGSPFAYLQKLGFEEGDDAIRKLQEWGIPEAIEMPDKLRESLKEFYKNEAFNNLTKEINKTIQTIKDILNNVIVDNEDVKKLEILKLQDVSLVAKLVEEIKDKLRTKLSDLQVEFQKDIQEGEYFSNKLREDIEFIVNTEINSKYVNKINQEVNTGSMNTETPIKTNSKIRENLTPEIKDNFKSKLVGLAKDKNLEYQQKLIKSILEVLEVDNTNRFYKELENELLNFVNELNKNIAYSENSYIYLIDRFSKPIIETLIETPRYSDDRKNKFKIYKDDIFALAMYYEDIVELDSLFKLKLVKDILNIDNDIDDIFSKEGISDLLKYAEFKDLLKFIKSRSIPLTLVISIIKNVKSKVQEVTPDNIKKIVDRIKKELEEKFPAEKTNTKSELDVMLDNLVDKTKIASNLADVEKEINQDIELIKKILKTAVIKAINLELPFISSFNEQICRIINAKWSDFIAKNYTKIKEKEISKSEKIKILLEEKKRAIESLKNLQTKI